MNQVIYDVVKAETIFRLPKFHNIWPEYFPPPRSCSPFTDNQKNDIVTHFTEIAYKAIVNQEFYKRHTDLIKARIKEHFPDLAKDALIYEALCQGCFRVIRSSVEHLISVHELYYD